MGSIWLKDGRQLTYREYGDPDGAPVLFIHGFSDSSTLRHYDDAYTATLGARIIAPDLPGIRGSSYDPQRTLLRWADDAIELVDALGLERFALVAISSGCSHASALASKLPDRVTRLSFAAPTGRYDRPGMESYVVADELKAILWLNRWGLAFLLRPIYAYLSYKAKKDPDKFGKETAFSYPSDAEAMLESPEQFAIFTQNFLEGFGVGGVGFYGMTRSVMRPWGFALSDVLQPVTIFYGDKSDLIRSEVSLDVAAQLPNCTTRLWPDAGRYSLVRRDCWTQLISAALAPVQSK